MYEKSFLLILAGSVIAGCSVIPEVKYKQITQGADMKDMADAYYLQRSIVSIEASTQQKTNTKDQKLAVTEIVVRSTPKEFRDMKVGIKPIEGWRTKTMVNVTKMPNTELVASIGSEVEETLSKHITEYGGAIAKVAALAVSFGAMRDRDVCIHSDKQPITLDLATVIKDKTQNKFKGHSDQQCIEVELGDYPVDAVDTKSDSGSLNLPTDNTSYFYYSSCRDATITIHQDAESTVVKTVRISDPSRVQRVQFPAKGSIVMHSECGVSVQTEKTSGNPTSAVIEALATQGKAIKEAIDSAKDGKKSDK